MTTLLGRVFPWTGREGGGGSVGRKVEIERERAKQHINSIEVPSSLDLESIKAEFKTA